MKKVKIKLPVSMVDGLSDYFISNSIMPLITYSSDEFFEGKLIAIFILKDEEQVQEFMKTEYVKYLQK